MGKHVQTIESQERILDTLNNMDVVNFANANVVILQELQRSMTQFKTFNEYVSNISELVGSTRTFADKIGQVMMRTDDLHVLGDNIISVFTQNRELMQFLQHHYSSLDNSHQLITKAVNGVSNTLDGSLQLLKEFTQVRIMEIQQLTLKEIDQIKNEYYEKWKHLEKLGQLEIVNTHLVDLKRQGSDHVGTFNGFNEQFATMIAELNLIKQLSENSFSVRITRLFTKLLGKKTITR
jgi:endonuclease/exonuclease/phosphatase family metal-dependent hydrolase